MADHENAKGMVEGRGCVLLTYESNQHTNSVICLSGVPHGQSSWYCGTFLSKRSRVVHTDVSRVSTHSCLALRFATYDQQIIFFNMNESNIDQHGFQEMYDMHYTIHELNIHNFPCSIYNLPRVPKLIFLQFHSSRQHTRIFYLSRIDQGVLV